MQDEADQYSEWLAEVLRTLNRIHREFAEEKRRVRREATAKRMKPIRYVGVQFAEDRELKPEIWAYIDDVPATLRVGDRVICPTVYGNRNGVVTKLWGNAVPDWVEWKGPYDRITITGWV